jgi:hypothetical protein
MDPPNLVGLADGKGAQLLRSRDNVGAGFGHPDVHCWFS